MRVCWHGETFRLLAERAVYRERDRALLIADLHLGKSAAYRAGGVPVPDGPTEADLARLERALDACGAERLIVLGDLLHAPEGRTEETIQALQRWRARRADLEVVLVRGNHDGRAGDPPADLGFRAVEEPWFDGRGGRGRRLALRHTPPVEADRGQPAMCGHVHPIVSLNPRRGGAGPGVRAPCFWFGETVAVLPAFGSFTGGRAIRARAGDRVFAVGPARLGLVREVALAPVSARRKGRPDRRRQRS